MQENRSGSEKPSESERGSDGWRVGRNPPSVRCSICLIEEPAPPADAHRRLHPLSQRNGSPFHPAIQPSIKDARENVPSSSHGTSTGIVSALPHRLSPATLHGTHSAMWVEFPQTLVCNCTPTRHPSEDPVKPE